MSASLVGSEMCIRDRAARCFINVRCLFGKARPCAPLGGPSFASCRGQSEPGALSSKPSKPRSASSPTPGR
eukprot:8450448-Alexandrium_andersonii.AAC.1